MDKEAILERIRTAREKTSAFEAENAGREDAKELERKAILEENKARDLPHIQAAEDEFGEIKVVNTRAGAVVVKKPHHLVFHKFSNKMSTEKGINDIDTWRLVRKCIVYPEVLKVEQIIEEYPGLTNILGAKVIELGNGVIEESEGK